MSSKRATSRASTCRPTPTACSRSPTTASAARLRQPHRHRQAAAAAVARHRRRPRALRARRVASGSGPATSDGASPDVVLACAGDILTMETVAAAWLLRERAPELRVRVVNVVDLMALFRPTDHPHGMDEADVRGALHPRPARGVRLPRLPGRRPPTHPRTPEPAPLPRAWLSARRAPPPPPSTWWCSTGSAGTTCASRRCVVRSRSRQRRALVERMQRHARKAPGLRGRAPRGHAGGARLALEPVAGAGRWSSCASTAARRR